MEKGSFQKSPFSRDSREFRDSRDLADCGKQRGIRPFSRDSREFRDFRDSRDFSREKDPFRNDPFFRSRLDNCSLCKIQPTPKYHTTGRSRSSADSPGARTLVFAAFKPFSSCEFRASITRTPFCAILWRSPKNVN